MQWAQLYLNQTDLEQLIDTAQVNVTGGDARQAVETLDLFDKFLIIRDGHPALR